MEYLAFVIRAVPRCQGSNGHCCIRVVGRAGRRNELHVMGGKHFFLV